MGPCERMSRSMARPSVVLPEPDSPTTPSVCPSRTSQVTPSTALMCPTAFRMKPARIGNQTRRSLASISFFAEGSACGGAPLGSAASSACV